MKGQRTIKGVRLTSGQVSALGKYFNPRYFDPPRFCIGCTECFTGGRVKDPNFDKLVTHFVHAHMEARK